MTRGLRRLLHEWRPSALAAPAISGALFGLGAVDERDRTAIVLVEDPLSFDIDRRTGGPAAPASCEHTAVR